MRTAISVCRPLLLTVCVTLAAGCSDPDDPGMTSMASTNPSSTTSTTATTTTSPSATTTSTSSATGSATTTPLPEGAMTFAEVREFLDTDTGVLPPCFECHHSGGDLPYVFKNDETLYDTLMTTMIERCENRTLVVPGDPDNSALYLVLNGTCGTVGKMPSGCYESEDGSVNYCTSHEDREGIRLWIQAGAPQ